MGKSDEVRHMLDERGVEHRDNDANRDVRYTRWDNGGKREVRYEEWSNGTTRLDAGNVTPEQAIAATVGNRTDLSKRLREVSGLHAFAELFGFSWADESDWTWHDVACAMADAVDAATVGNVGYGIQFADWCEFPPETMVGETVFDGEGNAIGWITNATVGRETLTVEQVRECVKGVYFEGYGDGATHRVHGIEDTDWQTIADKLNAMLGAETCKWCKDGKTFDGQTVMMTNHGWQKIRHCPNCGRKIRED